MIYTVKRIDEDLNFGCEERPEGVPIMAIVTLTDSSGEEVIVTSTKGTRFVSIYIISWKRSAWKRSASMRTVSLR